MSEPKSMGEYLALPEAEKMRLAALPPVRSEPILDDIRSEFRKHGWAVHMLTDAMLRDTVRSALTRYDEMQTAINGMAETVQGLREANAAADLRRKENA